MDDSRLIENLIYRYAELIDAGDFEGVAELFRHAEILAPGSSDVAVAGYDAVLQMYRGSARIYEDCGTPKTRHLTTNVMVEVEVDSASARSYFTVIQATDALPLQPIIAGRYHDEFVRSDAGWCFSRRSMLVDLLGDCSAHLLIDPP